MMGHAHLSDERLIEVCLDCQPASRERQHLEHCPTCRARRTDLERMLGDVTDTSLIEADAAFPLERLTRQHARIMKRIDGDARPARVLAFPAAHTHEPLMSRARPGMRWIAGAAAAGLLVGAVAGHVAHDFSIARPVPAAASISAAPAALDGTTWQAVATTLSEEEFLGQIETAIHESGSPALQPLDDLTPLVWEVAAH